MKTLVLVLLLLIVSMASADNENASVNYPVVTNHSYVVGPYTLSFDLIGIRDLEPTIWSAEAFQTERSDGVRYELSLKDKTTNESVDIGILRYRNPAAKSSVTDDYRTGDFWTEGAYGSWLSRADTFTGLFIEKQAIDAYTLCYIHSGLSWKATEKLLQTLYVKFDPLKAANESVKPVEP